jgi:hypothetical protein
LDFKTDVVNMPPTTLEFTPLKVEYTADYLILDINGKIYDENATVLPIQQAVKSKIDIQPRADRMVTAAVTSEMGEDLIAYYARDQIKNNYGLYTIEPDLIDKEKVGFAFQTDTVASAITFPHLDTLFGYGEDLQLRISLASDPEIFFTNEGIRLMVKGNYDMILKKTQTLLFRLTAPIEVKAVVSVVQNPQEVKIDITYIDIKELRVIEQHSKIFAVHTSYMKVLMKFIADTLLKGELNDVIADENTNIEDIADEVDLVNFTIDTGLDIAIASADIILNMSSILNMSTDFVVTCDTYACPQDFALKDGATEIERPSLDRCCRPASECEKCQARQSMGSRMSWCYSSWRNRYTCDSYAELCSGTKWCKSSDVLGRCTVGCPR